MAAQVRVQHVVSQVCFACTLARCCIGNTFVKSLKNIYLLLFTTNGYKM